MVYMESFIRQEEYVTLTYLLEKCGKVKGDMALFGYGSSKMHTRAFKFFVVL